MEQGRRFVEEESRAQRLIEFYCDMCDRASRTKLSMPKEGASLESELKVVDKITEEEEQMIMEDQRLKYGSDFKLYEKLDNILNKILKEVSTIQ